MAVQWPYTDQMVQVRPTFLKRFPCFRPVVDYAGQVRKTWLVARKLSGGRCLVCCARLRMCTRLKPGPKTAPRGKSASTVNPPIRLHWVELRGFFGLSHRWTGSGSKALKDGGVNPEQVQYVNAHGTSTHLNDKIETAAIKRVFGEHSKQLSVSSSKSMVGHLLGASGAIELAACALSIRDSKVHPTINYETPDPDCDLDYVPNAARELTVDYALSNSLGFGGHNTSLLVGKI